MVRRQTIFPTAGAAVGAVIGGGGATNYFGFAVSNSVTGDFGTVSGGEENTASSFAIVGGGENNLVASGYAVQTVGGGRKTMLPPTAPPSAVAMGNTANNNQSRDRRRRVMPTPPADLIRPLPAAKEIAPAEMIHLLAVVGVILPAVIPARLSAAAERLWALLPTSQAVSAQLLPVAWAIMRAAPIQPSVAAVTTWLAGAMHRCSAVMTIKRRATLVSMPEGNHARAPFQGDFCMGG